MFDNYIQQASYLTGIVAGEKTESNIIGMVGGYPIPEVNRLMHAFMEGARSVNPDVGSPGTVIATALWHMEPTIDRAIEAVVPGPGGSGARLISCATC